METPEQFMPKDPMPGPWEANFTMGTDWQYKPTNDPHKTGTQIINMLIETRAKGGNLLMNVGPKPDGEIQIEQEALLREVALWNLVNTEGIHNIRTWNIIREGDVWFTRSKTEPNTVYAFVQGEDSWRFGSRKEILLKTLEGNAQTKVSVLGFSGELIEYRKGADAKAYIYPVPLGVLVSAVRGPRLYTNGQWPNPVVLKIENVKYKPENKVIEQISTIDGAK
jgi:alpha-L-fucosidase